LTSLVVVSVPPLDLEVLGALNVPTAIPMQNRALASLFDMQISRMPSVAVVGY